MEGPRLLVSRIVWVIVLMDFREPFVYSVFCSAPDAPLAVLISRKVSSLSSHLNLWALSTVNGSSPMPLLLPLPLPSQLPPGVQPPLGALPRYPSLPASQPLPPLRPLPLPPPRHRPPAVHRHQLPALLVLTPPGLRLLVALLPKARTSPILPKSSSSLEAWPSLEPTFNITYE